MKKKKVKKLRLNRETLRSLEDREVEKIAGGVPTQRPWCLTIGTKICSVCPCP